MIGKTMLLLATLVSAAALADTPPNQPPRNVVAELHGKPIYADEVRHSNEQMNRRIVSALLREFAREQHLTASAAEIDAFLMALKMTAPTDAQRSLAEAKVLEWKVSAALYKKYGGEVIFQQANPLEPVGAMRQFLESEEKRGAFSIRRDVDRAEFYEYFRRKHSMVVPPNEVNFDEPWWAKATDVAGTNAP
jgi:hypothetical protein